MNKLMSVMRTFTKKDYAEMLGLMVAGLAAIMLFQPMSFVYAEGGLDNVLGNIGNIAGIIGGIILVIVLVKGIADYVKGEGTIGKIVIKVLCILLLIGLIVVATHISTLQNTMGGVATSAVNVVTNTASEALS